MVKLEVKIKGETPFYFYTMADCKEFLYVFKQHWCNVPFGKPKEIPDDKKIIDKHRSEMDRDPKERAESDLSWGFSLCRYHDIDETPEQKAFIESFIENN